MPILNSRPAGRFCLENEALIPCSCHPLVETASLLYNLAGLKDKDAVVRGRMTNACGQFLSTLIAQPHGHVCNAKESGSVFMRVLNAISQR